MNTYTDTTSSYSANNSPTLTAFFENRDEAASAVQRLVAAGIDSANVRLVEGNDTTSDTSTAITRSDGGKGFWASLEDFFFPDEDRATYSEGLRRGGYLVTVTGLTAALYNTALDILDDEGSIDLDERSATWKSEGWTPESNSSATSNPSSTVGQTAGTSRGGEDAIPVVEEELRVGKRDVNAGRVKVRAYTVATPVNEQVTLHDETVSIERRAVDRPVDGTETAFQDRTIEAEEHHEEAVVSKDARVVEEIAIRKTAELREETISDSVRKTEVEIEDGRATDTQRPLSK